MTDQEREELIEKMKTAVVNARLMGFDYENAARAALAVAEPVIREQCAKAAEGFEANRDWVNGSLWGNIRREVAAAIREGDKDE